jgi:hypothetical protein
MQPREIWAKIFPKDREENDHKWAAAIGMMMNILRQCFGERKKGEKPHYHFDIRLRAAGLPDSQRKTTKKGAEFAALY